MSDIDEGIGGMSMADGSDYQSSSTPPEPQGGMSMGNEGGYSSIGPSGADSSSPDLDADGGMSMGTNGGYSTSGTEETSSNAALGDSDYLPPSAPDGGMSAGTIGGYSVSGTSPDSSSASEPPPPDPKDWDDWSSNATNWVIDETLDGIKDAALEGLLGLAGIAEGPAGWAVKTLELKSCNPETEDAAPAPDSGPDVPESDAGPHSMHDDQFDTFDSDSVAADAVGDLGDDFAADFSAATMEPDFQA